MKEATITLIWIAAIPIVFLGFFLLFGMSYVFYSPTVVDRASKGAGIEGGLVGAGFAFLLAPVCVYFFRKKLRTKFLR